MEDHTPGRAVVVGANRGIGLGMCQALKARGWRVSGACRAASEDLRACGVDIIEGVSLDSSEGPQNLATALAGIRVSLLIMVAGVLEVDTWETLDFDAILKQVQINAIGPLRVVAALDSLLGEASKVVFITSKMGSFGGNTAGGMYGYRMSKAAANMAALNLAIDLKPRGIMVSALHPGAVMTEMYFSYHAQRGGAAGGAGPPPAGALTVEQSVRGLLEQVDALTLETSGSFRSWDGERLPW